MKNLLHLFFIGFSITSFAQINTAMPPEANTFYSKNMVRIKPPVKSIIEKSANNLNGRNVNIDSLSKVLRKEEFLKNTNQNEIEAIIVLIMVQASRNADEDLKNLVISMHKSEQNTTSQEERRKNITENKVESILANKSRLAENISLIMKRISGSEGIVIDNLR